MLKKPITLNLDYSSSRIKLDFGHYATSNVWCSGEAGLLRASHGQLVVNITVVISIAKQHCSLVFIIHFCTASEGNEAEGKPGQTRQGVKGTYSE